MIVGIDLGTSTSEAAFADDTGKVVVIPNRQGEIITPSIVHIKQNGKSIVGTEAGEYLFTRPESTFMEVKRKFGSGETFTAQGIIFTPELIQSHIIKYLVNCAREYTAEDITGAVITVPAYFTDIQRKQTIKAGELAGIRVERVINEPTAAAMDYGLQNTNECEYMLVYDFGGGTLDVTVLELFEGVIDVKSSCGNNRLGGKDFDELLMRHIAEEHYGSIMADPKAAMKLKQAAVACKTALSDSESAKVRLPMITRDASIDRTITRSSFEKLIRPLVESTGEQIDTALHDAGLSASDLQKVILVGGTTRVPLVREYVGEKMGAACIRKGDDDYSPELMVVRGAAIQAAIIDGTIAEENSIVLADVCPYTLGIKVVSPNGFKVDPLIRRNVTVPYEFSKVYSAFFEYQREILFEIYQGESSFYQENTWIGELNLDKLPRRRDERAEAEVTFSYDVNGLLHVTARALGNNNTAATVIDINKNDATARPPVSLGKWTEAAGAAQYRPLLRKAQKLIDEYIGTRIFVDSFLFTLKDYCDNLKADIILGDEDAAEENSGRIKEYLAEWEPPEGGGRGGAAGAGKRGRI